jgi:protein-S-isoprenylcysteine O-methyltransferase Ste14
VLLTRSANRTLTLLASAFLGFDGAALLVFGIWSHHPLLALIGAALFVSSGLVLLYWRWHQRQLAEMAEARRALRDETESLRELLRGN